MTSSSPQLIKLTIEKTIFGGKGLARVDGKVYMVKDAVKGDEIEGKITLDKGSFAEVTPLSFLNRPAILEDPPCPIASECGGCHWQGIPYETQLEWKKCFIEDAFSRVGQLELPSFRVEPSPAKLHYRNRVLVRGTVDQDRKVHVGFFKRASKQQIHTSQCQIADPLISRFLEKISNHKTQAKPQKFRMEIQVLPYFASQKNSGSLLLSLTPAEKYGKGLEELSNELQDYSDVLWAGLPYDLKKAPCFPFEDRNSLLYHTSPSLFQQVNLEQNHKVRELVKKYVLDLKPNSILDLYCGSGNLSLGLIPYCSDLLGIEWDSKAINIASQNTSHNSLLAKYRSGDAKKLVGKELKKNSHFDMIVVDPPRKGMKDAVPDLIALKPQHILYLSCDPVTLARDSKMLSQAYTLSSFHAFDFFPQTYHVESFAVFRLKKR